MTVFRGEYKRRQSVLKRQKLTILTVAVLSLIVLGGTGGVVVLRRGKSQAMACCAVRAVGNDAVAGRLGGTLQYLDAEGLQNSFNAYVAHGPEASNLVASIIKKAGQLAAMPVQTVTAKSQNPPSANKHDYFSLADYWWPNPATSSRLPYVRRDGEVNPETTKIPDKQYFNDMLDTTSNAALAYYYTGQEKYADKAAQEIKAWFIVNDTKMNPNLNFAQVIKGRPNDGTGLIDLRYLPKVFDSATLIANSPALGKEDYAALQTWAGQYLDWLLTSAPGKQQAAAANNHGSWYNAQVIALAGYVHRDDIARQYAERTKQLIAKQIKPDGSQPLELARTRAWDYSILNLEGLLSAGLAAKNTPVDVLNYTTADGVSIKRGIGYLTPYLAEKKWPYQQITPFQSSKIANLLAMAQQVYASDFGVPATKLSSLDPDSTVLLEFAQPQ